MNDYEQQRLENIRKNREVLSKLAIPTLPVIEKSEKTEKTEKTKKRKVDSAPSDLRRSRRLSKAPPEIDEAKPIPVQEDIQESREALKGSLNLTDERLGEMDEETIIALMKQLKNKTIDYSEFNDKRSVEHSSISSWTDSLTIPENYIAKVTPSRVYSLAFHPTSLIVFAGDKNGHLGIFDPKTYSTHLAENTNYNGITSFQPHRDSISSLFVNPSDSMKLYSSSYDGSIRVFDIESGVFNPILIDKDTLYYCLDGRKEDPNVLYYSTSDGQVGTVDVRQAQNSTSLNQLHEKRIRCVSLNPDNPYSFSTSSLDTSVRFWDSRYLNDSPVATFHHPRAVTSAFFCPNDGKKFITTCYDDNIRFYDNLTMTDDSVPTKMIKHNNQTGRWITPFKAVWSPWNWQSEPFFVIGNMKRTLDLYSGIDGTLIKQLSNESLTAQPAVNVLHSSQQAIASGTGSGKVCVWK